MRPAPDGWIHVRTVEEAKEYLRHGVQQASLDHDLGAWVAYRGFAPGSCRGDWG